MKMYYLQTAWWTYKWQRKSKRRPLLCNSAVNIIHFRPVYRHAQCSDRQLVCKNIVTRCAHVYHTNTNACTGLCRLVTIGYVHPAYCRCRWCTDHCFLRQGGICRGKPGNFPPHWIWPSLPLVCLKTSLPGKGWIPVTAEILLNCNSYQSTLSKGSKQIVFNFDSCYASLASNGPIILHSSYNLFIVHVVVSTSIVRLLCSPVMQINSCFCLLIFVMLNLLIRHV